MTRDFWKRHLLFRNYLRTHPKAAQDYYELKKRLASRFGSNREGYTQAKTSFVESIVTKAKAEQHSRVRRIDVSKELSSIEEEFNDILEK